MDPPSQNQYEVQRHPTQQGVKNAAVPQCTIVEFPPEVFSEITVNLNPLDLLSLARTSKILRRVLMSRTSRYSWQVALNNIPDLPPCPSKMCEPQYTSLLFSETCSTCGVRVFRRIDPTLCVRLCQLCFNEETIPVDRHTFKHLTNLVPRSDSFQSDAIGWVVHPFLYALRSELEYVRGQVKIASNNRSTLKVWRDAKAEELRKGREHATALRGYLDHLDVIHEKKLDEQEADAKCRLASAGWSQQDATPTPTNLKQWKELIRSPDLLSATNWTRTYPQLVSLMWSNRAFHQHEELKTRQKQYLTELHCLAINIQESLPLLNRVTIQSGSDRHSTIPKVFPIARYASIGDEDPSRRDTVQLFPSLVELQELPIIRELLEKDVGLGKFRATLQSCRHKVEHAIEEWRAGVEEQLLNILNSTSNDLVNDVDNLSLSTRIKSLQIPDPVRYLNILPPGPLDDTTIPKTTIIFHQPNHSCTSDISRLRPALQTLLRADSRFIRHNASLSYPLVCSPEHRPPPFSVEDKRSHGPRWNTDPILPDPQGSLICRRLLADLGRPDATHAELVILGNNYKCGRCGYPPTIWEVLVGHYREELDRWEQFKSASKKKSSISIVYQNLHDLTPRLDKPFVRMMSPKAVHKTLRLNYARSVDRRFCDLCSQLGLAPRSYRFINGDKECALLSHLRDVHDEHRPVWSTFRRDTSD